MKPPVILYKKIAKELVERLKQHFSVTELSDLSPQTIQKHADLFANVEGIVGTKENIDQAFLEHVPKLRAASTVSAGYDNFDVKALSKRGIVLMHTPAVLTESVADTTLLLMLASARRAIELSEKIKAGEWKQNIGPDWYGIDVHHKTLGIVGMGRIGMALAQRAHLGFGMSILYHARRHHPEAEQRFNARLCSLDSLLSEADFVCLAVPLTPETRHLISTEQLARMKSSAILINIGRGPVVDEKALTEALKQGTIHAAGLDVFEHEPLPMDSGLLALPNVVMLPHIGSATHETRHDMDACAVDNLIVALTGKVTENCVNPQVLG